MADQVARMEEYRSAFKILIVHTIRKRRLIRIIHRCEDNIRMEIGVNTRN